MNYDNDEVEKLISEYGLSLKDMREELLHVSGDLDKLQAFSSRYVDYKAGWYQDLEGNLYKYDGVIWDVVPSKQLPELEFLG